MECEYCHCIFSSKSNLSTHQRNAKYCLKIRNVDNTKHQCKYCNKYYSSSIRLESHEDTCTKYFKKLKEESLLYNSQKSAYKEKIKMLESIIKDQKTQISELQNTVKSVAIKGVEKSTNQTINLLPLTEEHMKSCAQYLTIDHIKQGAEGYAKYALEYPFKDRVQCVDQSRRKIKYKNNEGDYVTDTMMSKLAPKFFKCIEAHNDQLIDEFIEEIKVEIDVCLENEPTTKWEEEDRDDKLEKMNEMISMLCEYKGGGLSVV